MDDKSYLCDCERSEQKNYKVDDMMCQKTAYFSAEKSENMSGAHNPALTHFLSGARARAHQFFSERRSRSRSLFRERRSERRSNERRSLTVCKRETG